MAGLDNLIMKLTDIISESEASDEAKKKGLVSAGWGRWKDKSGKTVADTKDGKLVFRNDMPEKFHSSPRTAMKFARGAHGDQKYGDKPYSYHLEMVFRNAQRYGGSRAAKIAAVLHDVIEDTPISKEQIAEKFGSHVADIVDLVSNQPDKAETYKRIRTDKDAVFVKLCDRLANVTEGKKNDKYRKEQPLFKSILYRPGEFDDLWDAIEERLNDRPIKQGSTKSSTTDT